jgi:predicted RecA/RadA family phage recombinase
VLPRGIIVVARRACTSRGLAGLNAVCLGSEAALHLTTTPQGSMGAGGASALVLLPSAAPNAWSRVDEMHPTLLAS